jgi:O-acetylhomoserine (thiol)-lyase
MQRHVENTRAVAAFLAAHEAIDWVSYPSSDDPLVAKYVPAGPGAVFTFGVSGGYQAGKQFIEKVELASHLANVGDAKTLVIHPASTTHQQIPVDERAASGVGEEMIRISVGIEDVEDIIADLDRALGS